MDLGKLSFNEQFSVLQVAGTDFLGHRKLVQVEGAVRSAFPDIPRVDVEYSATNIQPNIENWFCWLNVDWILVG